MSLQAWIASLRKREGSPRRSTAAARRRVRLRVEGLEARLAPALLIVQTNGDSTGPVTPGADGAYSAPTLRSAIDFANANAGADTIQFAPALAGQTIVPQGNDTVAPLAFGGPTAFVVVDSLTIQGDATRGITIDGNGNRRLFGVSAYVTLNIQNMTLTGGWAAGQNGGDGGTGGGGGAGMGGAIYVNGATVNLLNCTLTANVATGGDGGNGSRNGAIGGGGGGTTAFNGGNGAADSGGGGGGGMAGPGGDADGATGGLGGADQYGNRAPANGTGGAGGGGGGGTATFFVAHSGGPGITPNEGGFGGGGGGAAGVSRLAGADHGGQGGFGAGGGGGGGGGRGGQGGFGGGGGGSQRGSGVGSLYGGGAGGAPSRGGGGGGGGAGMGGAVFVNNGTATFTNCTITGNVATGGFGGGGPQSGQNGQGIGGAVLGLGGTVTASNCTVYNNTGELGQIVVLTNAGSAGSASAVLVNTVVGRDGPPAGPDVVALGLRGARPPRISGQNNFLSNPGGFPRTALAGTGDPLLQPLADNGGPARTLLPAPGSPLIDAGHNAPLGGPASTDQRGRDRLAGAFVDIGAVEFPGVAPPRLRDVAAQIALRPARREITLTFSAPVTATPGAFNLRPAWGNRPIAVAIGSETRAGFTVFHLTASGPGAMQAGPLRLALDGRRLFDTAGNPLPTLTNELALSFRGPLRAGGWGTAFVPRPGSPA